MRKQTAERKNNSKYVPQQKVEITEKRLGKSKQQKKNQSHKSAQRQGLEPTNNSKYVPQQKVDFPTQK